MLAGIDYFVVVAYLVVILLLGYYFRKFACSFDDYFLGGFTIVFLSFYYVRGWEGLVAKVYLMEHEYQNILS